MANKEQKYEACIAKSTLPKGWESWYLDIDTWYPVIAFRDYGCMELQVDEVDDPVYTRKVGAIALGNNDLKGIKGGNWKVRKVKEKRCSK